MESPLFDQSRDPLLAFASEAAATPADREPAFLRTPTPYDGPLSITSVATDQPAPRASGGRPLTTVLVIAGVMAGFIGGYVFADRIITPGAAVTPLVAAPAPPPVPAPAPAPAPVAAAVASNETPALPAEPSPEPPRQPSVVQAARSTDPDVAALSSAPPAKKRTSIPPSTPRRSTITRPQPTAPPATLHSGAIQIASRPRDAKVLLDGNFVGLAPLSIPDVPEGLHEVRVELDGFSPWVGAVRVKGGSRAHVGASLQP